MDRTFRIEELLDDAGWLRRLAGHLVGDAQADDLVQDTWLAALRRPPRAGEMRPWLRRVLANRAKNAGRDRARREARELDALREPVVAGPDEIAHTAEAQRLLAEAVARLDEPLRAVVVLRYYQGLESPEVGARLGITASAVRTRLQRALEALRADLDGRVEGGRASWAALLVPLARTDGATAVTTAASSSVALAWPTLAVAAAACVVAGAVMLRWDTSSDGRASPIEVARAPALDGAAGTAREPEQGEALTIPQDRAPVRAATAASPDPTQAALAGDPAPADAVISGTVRVDGAAPQWPVLVSLEARVPALPPDGTRKRTGVGPRGFLIHPTGGSAFTFEGLPRDWRGRVVADGTGFGAGTASLEIDAPAGDLELELVTGPAVLGRLRDSSGRPYPREGRFEVARIAADGSSEVIHDAIFRCRPDGAFRLGCADDSELRVRVRLIVDDERAGYLVHETPPFVSAQGFEAGELALETVRTLQFLVRDPSGAPIEDALAWVDGLPSFRRRGPLTGPDGRGELVCVPDRSVDVRFTALGYSERVERVDPGHEPEVVLEPITLVEVRLLGSTASAAQRLRVSADRPALSWSDGAITQHELGGVALVERREPDETGGHHQLEFDITPGGPVWLAGVAAGVPLTIEALDGDGLVLDEGTLTLAEGGRASLVLGRDDGGGPPPKQTATMPVLERRSR